ncbi:MAG: CFI-box-CTERM domain-containing protein [Pseudomonadota bacterium]
MRLFRHGLVVAALLLAGTLARADHHSWKITEIYTNLDGTLQFIELASKVGGETGLNCCDFASQDTATGVLQRFRVPTRLPGDSLNRYVLIATAGFQAAYGLAPDYIMPDGYIATGAGALQYNPPIIVWASIPTNGVDSINIENGSQLMRPATPTNFAGQSITLTPDTTPPVISAIPGTLTIASNTAIPGNDERITQHFAGVNCVDDRDRQPVLDINVPLQLLPGVTTAIPITCRDESANLAEATGSVRLNTFADNDGDGISDALDPDDDNDGVPDESDAFPFDEAETTDTDNDGIGNNADVDDDGDGTPDNLDAFPLDPAESVDTDGDGIGNNADEDDDGDGIPDSIDDDVAPVITGTTPLVVNATGRFTRLDLTGVTATDDRDGPVQAVPDQTGPFTAGEHLIHWTARDGAGNTAMFEQTLHLLPKVGIRPRQVVPEGSNVGVEVTLSGDAPAYPVTVTFTLSGTADAADYNLPTDTLVINAGRTGLLTLDILSDITAEPEESLLLTVTAADQAWFDAATTHTIIISEANLPPTAGISARQSGGPRTTVYADGGPVFLDATATDPNGDAVEYDWRSTNLPLANRNAATASFDPQDVAPGNYMVWLTVSDGEHTTRASRTLRVEATAPLLDSQQDSDGDGLADTLEGTGDSDADGIPDYLDNNPDTSLLPAWEGLQLQTGAGLSLSLGENALGAGSAAIDARSFVTPDVGYRYPTGLLDFEIGGLGAAGDAASIVIPLNAPIPAGADYRKFSVADGWQPFVVDANNALKSAATTRNLCPLPGDTAYQDGLTPGHYCILLTLTDGGPNDADGELNRRVLDPGGLALVDLPPDLSTAASLTLEATSAAGLPLPNDSVTGFLESGICEDAEDGVLPVTNSFTGDALLLGTTDVLFSCVDTANNRVEATVQLTLVDTTPPVLSVPPAISIESREVVAGSDAVIVTALAATTCTDTVSGERPIVDDTPATFGFGTTTITLSCSDAAGNTANGTLAVTISSPPVPRSQSDRGAGCFIATAAYGSHLDPHVDTLRSFRDQHLATNAPGRAIISAYYTYSPPLADRIRASEPLMAMTRLLLTPVVYLVAYPDRFAALALMLLLLRLAHQQHRATTQPARTEFDSRD